jgi:four helix bundle protein
MLVPDEKKAIRSYRDLLVWQKAMDLVVLSYRLTNGLPKEEQFGIVSQIRRVAVSVPANIAEGHGRGRTGDYLHHLRIARGSLMELETHFLLTERLAYTDRASTASIFELTQEISKMLQGLMKGIRDFPDS